MKRVAIYARYSSELQSDGYSIAAQLAECRRFIESKNGWQETAVYVDEAESAKTTNRPNFRRMVADAGNRQFDIVVCHKLDRFSRSVTDLLLSARDLERSGVALASATEQFDFTTPIGRLFMVILAALAQWFLDNLSQEVQKGKKARAEAGYWNGALAHGYEAVREHDGDKSVPVPNEDEAACVRLAFQLYATGLYSDMDVAAALNEAGHRPRPRGMRKKGMLWTRNSVAYMLTNRFYVGEVEYKGVSYPGVHEPIISPELFERCQEMRARRRKGLDNARKSDRTYILTGVARCARCGERMVGQYTPKGDKRYYGCRTRRTRKGCDQGGVPADAAEAAVVERLSHFQIPGDWAERARQIMEAELAGRDEEDVERKRRNIEAQLQRQRDLYELGDIDRAEYLRKREEARAALAELQPRKLPDLSEASTLFADFAGNWQSATPAERKQILRDLLSAVYLDVETGPVVRVEINPELAPFFVMPD